MQIANFVGLDKAVLLTLLARTWSIVGGVGTLFFIGRFLSPELQGYYYTFNSLIALQVFVELGLNYAIVQFVSHEMAWLQWADNGTVIGKAQSKRRLQSLIQFAFSWFGVAALLVLVALWPAGIFFFETTVPQPGETYVRSAWSLIVVFTALILLINAGLAILEGCNKVTEVAKIRFAQILASTLGIWISLAAGAGLYALAFASFLTALVGAVALLKRFRHFFLDIWRLQSDLPGIHWRGELWPFQWRIAISWASGYLIFQLFTPLLFATHGPIVAGQMGMSLQIIAALNGAAMVWITTKAPLYGQLIAQGNRTALNKLFLVTLKQSLIMLALGILAILAGLIWLQSFYQAHAARLLPPEYFVFLCLVCMANHIVFAEASYLRAHKCEPFMIISVVNGVVTALLSVILILPYGLAGAVFAFAFGSIAIALIGGSIITKRKIATLNALR